MYGSFGACAGLVEAYGAVVEVNVDRTVWMVLDNVVHKVHLGYGAAAATVWVITGPEIFGAATAVPVPMLPELVKFLGAANVSQRLGPAWLPDPVQPTLRCIRGHLSLGRPGERKEDRRAVGWLGVVGAGMGAKSKQGQGGFFFFFFDSKVWNCRCDKGRVFSRCLRRVQVRGESGERCPTPGRKSRNREREK